MQTPTSRPNKQKNKAAKTISARMVSARVEGRECYFKDLWSHSF